MLELLQAELKNKFPALPVFRDEPMKKHTSFQIGGPADLLVCPRSLGELEGVSALVRSFRVPLFVLGNGTNLLVGDRGIRGVVLKTAGAFTKIRVLSDGRLEAESGALLSRLAVTAAENGLAGLAFAHGIPGTVGGAVLMNAGAYGGEMAQVVTKTTYLDKTGALCAISGAEHGFGYRESVFSSMPDSIIVAATLSLSPGSVGDIRAKMRELAESRSEKQPLTEPSAGSAFKRPPGHFAGKLIADCGLKGYACGGAFVSEKHAGFVVARAGATANDVRALLAHIQETVYRETGVSLEPEIRFVGEW
ncbi:UDP-N-acetylmuramate dehydrogenase [Oscillospiraceae bacterium OttesenSCG-928-G22]|nr:UDP-N-acetylmuramate dehydrogenase [Oscillospiraceae bacterium OttesenSCG-928-G22]